ncbi:zinc-binding dehydrogenase [Mycobacterium hodleri]|uniref:Zinc-binding dehydrogenase n=1 Tax=Mycolicibacterium hodleri TaxID=49897 RepID=A0A544VRT0_9MYCO|nr:zinc-binding dehydrogenase [Mycolicibacterium hodleri]TQR82696.1 zinc-binding dehydrogenase [Mycolicibacterium hodleri]
MRAVAIHRFGDPSGMAMVEVPSPVPGAGQVVVDVEAIGVGGVDAMIRRGTLSAAYGFPVGIIPGSEVAGSVTAVGVGVDESWIGRRVWAFTGVGGGYAEHAVAVTLGSAGPVARRPRTRRREGRRRRRLAHFALQHAHFMAGDSVLVRGAAGSIGIAAVELAAGAGARLVAVTTSSPERGERLRELGATHVLDRSGHGDSSAPATVDVIVDVIGGPEVPAFIDRLAPNGRMVVAGMVAGPVPVDFGERLLNSFQMSRSFGTFSLDTVADDAKARVRAAQFAAAIRGELHAVVHDTLPLEQAAEAHRQMDEGRVFGRIVLTPGRA